MASFNDFKEWLRGQLQEIQDLLGPRTAPPAPPPEDGEKKENPVGGNTPLGKFLRGFVAFVICGSFVWFTGSILYKMHPYLTLFEIPLLLWFLSVIWDEIMVTSFIKKAAVVLHRWTREEWVAPQGWTFKYPLFETVHESEDIKLKLVTLPYTAVFPTKSGVELEAVGEIQYYPSQEMLSTFILNDEKSVEQGLKAIAASELQLAILAQDAERLMDGVVINPDGSFDLKNSPLNMLREKFLKNFEGSNPNTPDSKFERKYGIIVTLATLTFRYESKYQEARAQAEVNKKFRESAKAAVEESKGDDKKPTITFKEAMNDAQVLGGKAQKQIVTIDGDPITAAIAGLFKSAPKKDGGEGK